MLFFATPNLEINLKEKIQNAESLSLMTTAQVTLVSKRREQLLPQQVRNMLKLNWYERMEVMVPSQSTLSHWN